MIGYTYAAPKTAGEALALLRKNDAQAIVSLQHIAEFKTIKMDDAGCVIGSRVTLSELKQHSASANYPALTQALASISDPHLLNHTTMEDSLNASDIELSSVTAALLAMDADVVIVGDEMEEKYAFSDFLQTDLTHDELVAFVRIVLPDESTSSYENAGFLSGSKPICGVAVARQKNADNTLRIVLGGCTDKPVRLQSVEAALAGKELNASTVDAALEKIEGEPLTLRKDLPIGEDYLRHLIKALTKKAILKL
ncbi:carbon monoxide dehydrogenase [Persicitalea jodogahamensis]|uniref:Carbon monoxide dehydrogenase n=2 Tax=Persicitalea jodogahamensis TaxID=402147 RepID=A0A8J3G7P9_9BACT|nr:carbon monoxide dehydrogenase [Persicitalea jodogahamensis]